MTVADDLIAWLERRPSVGGEAIVGWRFEVVEGEGVRIGVRNSSLGGPYEGPGVAVRLGGALEIHWSDGLVTRAGLDRRAILDPDAELEAWRADALTDRSGCLPPLADPAVVPEVEVFDPVVADAIDGGTESFLRLLQVLVERSEGLGVRRIDAVLRASRGERSVATSRGFRARWNETACSIDVWGDEVAGASYGRRCRPGADDLDRLAEETSLLAASLGRPHDLPSNPRGVIFMPIVAEQLLRRFLLASLSGRAIREGRSPFSRADLESGLHVLRDDLDLTIDTTLPFEPATAPCSSEGVPAGRVALISWGRLTSPMLDLSTAAELGLPATPAPRGRPAALLTSALPEIDLGAAQAQLGDGVIVRDLPGLHTQPARRAAYALVAPDAQVVVNGEATGRCAVRLAGGLLHHLRQPSTQLVRISGDLNVGLLVLTGVELLPA